MLLEGTARLMGNILESTVSTQVADKITNKAGIKNPIGKLALGIGASSIIDKALSFITDPLKKLMGIDKEMVAHSQAGQNFKTAVGIAGFATPFMISDKESLQKYGPVAGLLAGGLLLYGMHAQNQEQKERKRLGLLNGQGNSLQNIFSN